MILITSLALPDSDIRYRELLFALKKNSQNPLISKIIIVTEDNRIEEVADFDKVSIYPISSRTTFRDLVDCANAQKETVIIANSDIIFDHTLKEPPQGMVFCLTRWIPDLCSDSNIQLYRVWLESGGMSFDSYIFNPPINVDSLDFYIGMLGCDSKFAYELHRAGLQVSNPSAIIRSGHVHASGIRAYDDNWVKGSYLKIPITDSIKYDPNSICVHRIEV